MVLQLLIDMGRYLNVVRPAHLSKAAFANDFEVVKITGFDPEKGTDRK